MLTILIKKSLFITVLQMLRKIFKKTISMILSNKLFNNHISKSTSFGKIFWNFKEFFEEFPWWNRNIINWWDIFLIYLNIKKKSNILFRNGFIYKDRHSDNLFFLLRYIKLIENNIKLEKKNKKILARINNLTIFYPHFNDAIILIYEIFVLNEYDKFDYRDKIIIDIGGYIGDSALYFVTKGAKKVYVYEPDLECFKLLKENIRINNSEEKIIAFNTGVSDERKKQTFYITKSKGTSGTFASEYLSENLIIEKKDIELIPFKDIIKGTIDILKIDCEGCEYKILENILQNNFFEKINEGIIIETHNIDSKRNSDYARSLIKKIGFKKIYSFKNIEFDTELIYSKK